MMHHSLFRYSLGFGVSLLTACASNGDSSSELGQTEGVPEQAAFQLAVTGDHAAEGTAVEDDQIDPSAELGDALDALGEAMEQDVAPELRRARGHVRELNAALRHFMQPIVALVRNTEPTTDGNVKVWGPVERAETEYRFVLRHGTRRHYGWLLQAREAGSADEFVSVAAGRITVEFLPRRGRGSIGIDLDTLRTVDPTVTAKGMVLARFAHSAQGSLVGYRLRDFASRAAEQPINAWAQRVHLSGGTNRLRLAYYGNVEGTASDAPEFVLARVRHKRGAGGRADLLVAGGDVSDGHFLTISECWNAHLSEGFRVVRDCPADGPFGERCELVSTRGDAGACPGPFALPEFPPSDPNAAMSDPESPVGDVTPPETMPDGLAPEGD